jgi:hypothetical protein
MRSVVVFESWFGNTRKLAEAIAEALRREGEVEVVSVDDPRPDLERVDLLVVGAPTHVHGLSSALSRRSALGQLGVPGEAGVGVRGWLREAPEGRGRAAAAFDTRAEGRIAVVGSAARGIGRRLGRRGYTLVAPPESFLVLATAGPLRPGEAERAARWARALAAAARPVAVHGRG